VSRRWPSSIVALQHRNFRLIWIGLLISFSGSMMQNAALLWHVSLLVPPERKALALGFVGLARVVPVVLFSMISGVVADAVDRRRVLLYTQLAAGSVALALAALAMSGITVVWPVYVLSAIGAAVGSFDLPARQSLIPTLVPREHLPNAITLGTIMFQTASVVGPALAGIVIAAEGVGAAYIFNALSYLFVLVALLMMRESDIRKGPVRLKPDATDDKPAATTDQKNATDSQRASVSFGAAMEGLRFVFRSPLIRSTMLLDFFATFFASATALLPIFAQDILHVGATGYGWLFAAPAVGSFLASGALIPVVEHIERRGLSIVLAVAGHGVATIVFGFSRAFWLTFLCLALVGATDAVSTVLRNVIRQLETPDRLRGRMTGINMVFFMGGPQLGELEAGAVANVYGAPFSVVSGGIGCILATLWIALATPDLTRYRSERDTARPT
jgi:MFS family permease